MLISVLAGRLPGLALALAIGLAATLGGRALVAYHLNAVALALAAGLVLRIAVGLPDGLRPGLALAVKPMLRLAIVLLGLNLTLGELLAIGPGALLLAVVVVVVTFAATMLLAQLLRVERTLAALIGTGTAVCGASAIVAAGQALGAREPDVVYALGVITLLGTVVMVALPGLSALLGLDAPTYGLWAGLSLHEVVQAVGAAAAGGPEATDIGTVAKLARVVMLAPVVLLLALWARAARMAHAAAGTPPAVPWFVLGFLGCAAVRSADLAPAALVEAVRLATPVLLAAAVAALGLSTDLRAVRTRGARPLLLGIGATLVVLLTALAGLLVLR